MSTSILQWLQQLDLSILRWINQVWTNPFLDWFFPRMAAPSIFLIPGIILGLGLLWKGRMRGRLFLLLMAVVIGLGDAVIVNGLKKAVNRPRPHETVQGVRLVTKEEIRISNPTERPSKGRSFPSAHVSNNVALALVVVAFYGRRYCWIFLWAFLMGWNRVYLGVHFPSDVLFSIFLSMTYTGLILFVARSILKRYGIEWSFREGLRN